MPETDLICLSDEAAPDGHMLWAGSARWPDGLNLGTCALVPADVTPVVWAQREGDSAMIEVLARA